MIKRIINYIHNWWYLDNIQYYLIAKEVEVPLEIEIAHSKRSLNHKNPKLVFTLEQFVKLYCHPTYFEETGLWQFAEFLDTQQETETYNTFTIKDSLGNYYEPKEFLRKSKHYSDKYLETIL